MKDKHGEKQRRESKIIYNERADKHCEGDDDSIAAVKKTPLFPFFSFLNELCV